MKKFVFVSVLMLLALTSGAQERFSCHFILRDTLSRNIVAEGDGFVQGDCYRLETAAGILYCNGVSRWIYNSESDELVIQDNDISFMSDIDLDSISASRTSVVSYGQFVVEIKDMKRIADPWPGSFFIIDPDSFGPDTIITDLRQ